MSSNPKAVSLIMDSEPRSDMDDEAEHHEEDGELECKVLKSRRDMDGQIALLRSIKHHWPNKLIVSRTVRYQTEP
ncbi:hypothetical protein Tco_1495527, partial [Tanacetum coccineum]